MRRLHPVQGKNFRVQVSSYKAQYFTGSVVSKDKA